MVSQQDILDQLERLKRKDRPYLKPADYHKFMPNAIPNVPQKRDTTAIEARGETIVNRSKGVTDLNSIMHQNTVDFHNMQKQALAVKRAKAALAAAQKSAASNPGIQQTGRASANITTVHSQRNPHQTAATQAMASGPKAGPVALRGVGVGQNLARIGINGHNTMVNASAAPRFQGFLQALAGTGYKIQSLGGYANRNIAGTGTKSLHAYGLAIDINPAQNPVTWNGHPVTNMPKGVGRLAAKYGLAWGGNWNGSKRDTMHFSVPYNGTK